MPPKKPSQLHKPPKGKPTSIAKPTLTHQDGDSELNHEESVKQYQVELLWCIHQLEKVLAQSKATDKNAQEIWKALQILKNNNQPIIRKRQLMRQHFGDYRAKMLAEEKKLVKMAAKMKIQSSATTTTPAKATFLRKSAFLTSGNENFKFNFKIPTENLDTGNKQPNLLSSNTQNCLPDGNTETNILAGNIESSISTGNTDSSIPASNTKVLNNAVKVANTNFKFNFSNKDFKFNFSSDN